MSDDEDEEATEQVRRIFLVVIGLVAMVACVIGLFMMLRSCIPQARAAPEVDELLARTEPPSEIQAVVACREAKHLEARLRPLVEPATALKRSLDKLGLRCGQEVPVGFIHAHQNEIANRDAWACSWALEAVANSDREPIVVDMIKVCCLPAPVKDMRHADQFCSQLGM